MKIRLITIGIVISVLCILIKNATETMCANGIQVTRHDDEMLCCALSCWICGGGGCSQRPGGDFECCTGHILEFGKSCNDYDASCIIDQCKVFLYAQRFSLQITSIIQLRFVIYAFISIQWDLMIQIEIINIVDVFSIHVHI